MEIHSTLFKKYVIIFAILLAVMSSKAQSTVRPLHRKAKKISTVKKDGICASAQSPVLDATKPEIQALSKDTAPPQEAGAEKIETSLLEMFKDQKFQEFLSAHYQDFHKKEKTSKQISVEEQERKRFYTEYLAKYYPKVFVIRQQFFAQMTLDQMVAVLKEIVDVFTEKPWFYFVDKQDEFIIVRYWEYIVDQLSFISDFLRKSYVDMKTKKVIDPKKASSIGSLFGYNRNANQTQKQDVKSLLTALDERQKNAVHEFYALCFDYLIKLFNEGILLRNSRLANRFLQDLDFVMNKLVGSEFEPDYQEVLKTCKELLKILEYKYGLEQYDDLDDDSYPGNHGMARGY